MNRLAALDDEKARLSERLAALRSSSLRSSPGRAGADVHRPASAVNEKAAGGRDHALTYCETSPVR